MDYDSAEFYDLQQTAQEAEFDGDEVREGARRGEVHLRPIKDMADGDLAKAHEIAEYYLLLAKRETDRFNAMEEDYRKRLSHLQDFHNHTCTRFYKIMERVGTQLTGFRNDFYPHAKGELRLAYGVLERRKARKLIQWSGNTEAIVKWALEKGEQAVKLLDFRKSEVKALLTPVGDKFADKETGEVVDWVGMVEPDAPYHDSISLSP